MSQQSRSDFDETQWVKHIQQTLDQGVEEDTEIPVTIFGVPKALMISDPHSYIPNQVAIGPYHHLRAELYDMERYKIAAAKRNQKQELDNVKLKTLVEHLMKFEMWIRASYHRPLSFGCEALAWMMAVDASFLFEFLQVCAVKGGKAITRIPSRMAHLIDLSGNKTAHNAILRDIIMLENQIPLLVMRMLLELQFSSIDLADERLLSLLTGLSKDLSPFQTVVTSQSIQVNEYAHMLEFLYRFIVPKTDSVPYLALEIDAGEGDIQEDQKEGEEEVDPFEESPHLRHLREIVV